MTCESAPKGAPETAGPLSVSSMPSGADMHDDLHRAWCAGYEQGLVTRWNRDIEDEIQRRMHEESLFWLGMARKHATERHGPAWAGLVCGNDEGAV